LTAKEQLEGIVSELEAATARLHALAGAISDERWTRRNDPQRWSVGECMAHLNLTTVAYLPRLDAAIAAARARGEGAPARYRRDLVGWMLWKMSGPMKRPHRRRRMRVKTAAAFVPEGACERATLVAEFERLQRELIARVRQCEGLPLQRVRVHSPFNERVAYNLYSCLTVLATHEHRHLQQAEMVWAM
jgi:hypothetical protein